MLSQEVGISQMKEMMETTKATSHEMENIVDLLKGFHEEIKEKVDSHQEHVNIIKGNIQRYLRKIKNNEHYNEEEVNALVLDSSQLSSIITLTQRIDEKMNLIDQLDETLRIEDITKQIDSCIQVNLRDKEHGRDLNGDNSSIIDRPSETPTSSLLGKKRRHKTDEDDESFTLSQKNKNESNEEDNHHKNVLFKSTRQVSFICRRKRKPLIYCKNLVEMEKYSVLFSNRLYCNFNLCEESSDFIPSPPTITPKEKVNDLSAEKRTLFPIVLNDIRQYSTKYLYDNFEQLLQVRTLYYCTYNMIHTPPDYNYEYLTANTNIVNSMKDFRFVKLVLIRKSGGKIQNVILGCSNLFASYITRKDSDGNTLIKGELKVPYETFHFYFLTGIKGFGQLLYVQIEVYVHKYELFDDYNDKIDKTNLKPEVIRKYKTQGTQLKRLRCVDKELSNLA